MRVLVGKRTRERVDARAARGDHAPSWTPHQPNKQSLISRLGEALDKRREVLGPRHPDTLLSIYNFAAFLLYARGKRDEARTVLGDAPDVASEVLGEGQQYTRVLRELAEDLR